MIKRFDAYLRGKLNNLSSFSKNSQTSIADALRREWLSDTALEALEPRIMLDAAGAATGAELASNDAETKQIDARLSDTPLTPPAVDDEIDNALEGAPAAMGEEQAIVFIDESVEDIRQYLDGIDGTIEIVLLDADTDGVEQIAAVLAERRDLDAIHIISHGQAGALFLGNATLDVTSMQGEHRDELAIIAQALGEDGDILIYGCDFTAGEEGLEAAMLLGALTGADIAASDDATGHTDLGGNWELETTIGQTEAAALTAQDWEGTLVTDAQVVGSEAFMRSTYVQVGVTPIGTLGAANSSRPSGYQTARASYFGIIANPQADNWSTYDGDFVGRGAPDEGFSIQIAGVNYTNNTDSIGVSPPGIPGSITGAGVLPDKTFFANSGEAYITWSGTIAGVIQVDRTISLEESGHIIRMETTLTNISGGTLNNIYWMQTINPDGDGALSGQNTTTTNTIVSQPGGALADFAIVSATQTPSGSDSDGNALLLMANDPRARVTYGGTGNNDAEQIWTGGGTYTSTVGSTATADVSISLSFNIGNMAAGQSETFSYSYGTTAAPIIDLDADNSSGATGLDYQATYTIGGAPVSVVDSDVTIFDPNSTLISAGEVLFDNPQADDRVFINGTDVTGGGSVSVGPVTWTVSLTGGYIYISSTSDASLTDYENALKAITLDNASATPSTVDRELYTQLNDGNHASSIVKSTISFAAPVIEPPVVDLDSTDTQLSVLDNFSTVSWSGSDGPDAWAGPWTDNDNNASPSNGRNRILTDGSESVARIRRAGEYIERAVDLSGNVTATLSFEYKRINSLLASEEFRVFASSDGVNFTQVFSVNGTGSTDSVYTTQVVDISEYISNNTTVRFESSSAGDNGDIYINSVGIDAESAHYTTTYTTNGGAVAISSTNSQITDSNDTNMESGSVVLTNAVSGDRFLIGGVPVADTDTGTIGTVSYSISESGGQITISLSGTATLAEYESAIEAISFEALNAASDASDRIINVTVNDGSADSNTAVTTIAIILDNDGDGVLDIDDIDDDNDGILDVDEDIVLFTGADTWNYEFYTLPPGVNAESTYPITTYHPDFTLNPDGTYSTTATPDMTGTVPNGQDAGPGTQGIGQFTSYAAVTPGASISLEYQNGGRWEHVSIAVLDTYGNVLSVLPEYYSSSTNTQTVPAFTAPSDGVVQIIVTISNPGLTYNSPNITNTTVYTGFSFTDTDGDNVIDRFDIDSDNDGITDNVEAQATAAYIAPSGMPGAGFTDGNGNGLDDNYEVAPGTAGFNADGIGLAPVDTDGDSLADFRDTDSDDDTIADVDEAGHGITQAAIDASADTDNDGLKDVVEGADNNDGFDVNDENLDATDTNFLLSGAGLSVLADGSDAVPLVRDLRFRADNTPVIDLNSTATGYDDARDWSATYTEDSSAVRVSDTDAGVSDMLESDITTMTIVMGGVVDGAFEQVSIGDNAFDLSVSSTVTVFAGTVSVDIAYVAGSGTFTITNSSGAANPIPQADLQSLVRFATYRNTSQAPTAGNRTLTFTVTDAAGNVSSNAVSTITVVPTDDPLFISGTTDNGTTDAQVLESQLATGSAPSGGAVTVSGSFTIAAPDGLASLDVGGTPILETELLASATTPVTVSGTYGSITINGFNGTTGEVSYSYTLNSEADHSSGAVSDSFSLTLTDDDGDTLGGTLGILIVDDVPTANADSAGVSEDNVLVASGNVVTDAPADVIGADGSGTPVTGIVAGTGSAAGTGASVGTSVTGTYGTLVLGDDGAYTYTLNNSDPAVQALGSTQSLSDVFTYEITDGDGDTAQASLSITISGSDDPLAISGTTDNGTTDAQVLESQLATGSAPSGGAVTVSGSFTIAAPDGLLSLDVGGTPILETELLASATTSITVSGTYGSITINGFNGTTGEVSYSYTLNSEADHSSGAVSDSFSLTLTDDDGDTLGGTLGILIVDDVPTANADSAGVSEDNVLVASGNVVTDAPADVIGADGSGTPVTGIVAGTGSAAGTGASVGTSVTGTYGTLVLGDDGAYTYTLNNSDPAVQALGSTQSLSDVFTYEITDGDGDTAQASLSITISGSDDPLFISGTTDNGTTDAQVLESQLATGSAPSGGAVTVSGSFTIAAPDGLLSLDVGGTPILETELLASATTSITVSGTYGSITINGFNGTTGEVSYSYTLNSEADHSSGAVSDSFSLTLTDDDGDTLGGTLGILIVDDVPTANADSAGVSEDNVLVASGNVVTDAPADVIGADGSGTPVTGIVAGTGSAAGTGASVGTSVTGTYGTLVLGDDGAYTYTLNNSDPAVQALGSTQSLSDVFTYEITDGDGDTAQASLSITISGSDDPLAISGTTDNGTTDAQVLESQLATGSAPSGGAVTVSGSFTIAAPDGLASLDVGGTPILETELLASATTSITVSGTYGSITINGFNGTTGEVSYSYTLNSEADHSSGAVSDSFSLTLTDDDGDTLGGTLGILIVDDVPTANADSAGVSEDNVLVASGNVVTDAPADVIGADGSGTPVTGIVAGTGSAAGTGASVGTSVTGTYGTLVLGDDGAYTYTLNNSDPAVQALGSTQSLSDVFTYEITDGDGDTAQASLSITISGSDDPLFISGTTDNGTTDAQVLESQLATGSAPSGGAVTVSGSFTIAAPDGLASLDVGGTPILETELLASATTSITVSGTYGSITINGFNGTTGEVSYSYTLNSEADHSSGAVSDSFSLTLTDDDGDTLGGTLGILIVDDVPTANADSAGVSEDNVLVASGNVVTDAPADVIGADGSGTPVTGIVAGTGSAAGTGASVGTSVTGTYGTLVLGDDGAYTYTLNNSDPAVQALGSTQSLSDVFTYEITDGDGDTAQASLSITISGSDDPLAISGTTDNGTTDAQVLESQLATGSAPSGGAVTVSGSFTIAAPDGLLSLDVGGTPILETELLASATTSITVSGTYGSITINGFNGTTGEVSYSYTLNSEADHSSGAVSDSFSLTLTDDDGDTLGGTLGILIVDDVPTANADSAGVSEDNVLVASGNVVTDAPADVIGADGSGTPVTGIVAGTGSAAGTGASVGTSVTGTYGTLVLGDDGAYTYTLNNSDPAVQALGSTQSLSDVFTYEITDGDGDTAQASLSITISGSDDPLFISGTTDNGTTDAQVLESQLATGSAPSGGAVTVSGSFTIAAPDGLASLDVGGTPILETELLASATTSITVSGTYGSITINGFNGTTGEVSYSYTLNSEADHSSGAVSDSFSLTLTDDDGDTLGGTLGILIVDDVPTANADSAGVSEDNVLVASGNVVTDAPADVIGADGSGTPVTGIVAGTGSAAGTGASVGTSVTGTYGTLVLGDDGAYTYTLNNSDPAVQALGSTQSLSDVFTYEITDGDGDTAQASLSITISGSDDPLAISGTTDNGTTDAQVLESQLATGSAPSGGAVTVSGSFTIAAPDGLASLDVGGTPILETELLASATTSITVSGTYGSITINGFNGTTGEVSYSYTLNSEADHSSGAVSDSFSLTLTDDDGDTLGGTLGILIVDDVPTANADSAGVSEDNVLVASGNVVTDAPADVIGADGSGTPVTGIVAGTGSAAGTGASVGTSVTGTYGTLVLGDDGAYTYTLNNSDPAVQALGSTQSLSDVFTYEITDGDGDTAQASLSITISGSDDPLFISGTTDNGTTDAQVLESQLATGSAPSGGAVTVSGSFTIAAPDGLASLDVGGTPILETELLASATTSITVSGTYGSITINGFNGTTGEVSYSYTLNSEADHSSGAVSDSFSLTLTDDDGDTLGGTLGILIVDDVPTANADSAGVSEDNVLVASGNVVTDAPADVIGADGSGTPVTGIVAGTGSAAGTGASVGTSVTGTYGTLVLGDDGAYTYTLNNSDPAVQALGSTQSLSDVFTYEITDGDGDTAQASLSITISGSDDPLAISGTTDNGTTDAQVLESQLATGSAPSGGAVTVSGSFTIAAPDGLASLDVGGTPILETELLASATTSITVSGTYGSITINGFNGTTGEVSYSYTLNSEADHSSGAVSDSFSLTLTDDDGDTLGGTLGILIVDDVPTANADSAGVSEDNVLVASGNVVTDAPADVIGADGSGTPVTGIVAGTGSAAGTGASVGTSVTGTYGTLVLGDDGAYTYTLNNSDPAVQALGSTQSLSDVFTYEITDGDGDTAQASLSITISGSDDPLFISGTTDNGTTDAQVLESQLATGSAPSGGAVTVSGSFTIAAPDGLASLDVGGTPILETELLASATTSITVSGTYGSITINGFNGTTGEVSYSYTLNSEADHSSGAVSDSFSLTLTDDDGDTLGGTLGILIVDDVPTANADSAGVSEDNVLVASGNVVTDAPADVIGADGSGTPVTGIVAGTGSAAGTGASVGTSVTGTYGTLVLGDDGAYTYTLNNSDPAVQALGSTQSLSDVFTYEITDGDGDTAQASLSITISGSDDPLAISGTTDNGTTDAQVLESQLATGSAPSGGAVTVSGSFTIAAPDGLASLDVGGTPILETELLASATTSITVSGTYGSITINGFNGTTGEVSYSYTLNSEADHSSGAVSDSFSLTLTDDDGDTLGGTLGILIVDDVPTANADSAGVSEDNVLVASGNVVTDAPADVIGADGSGTPVTGIVAGTGSAAGTGASVGTSVTGTYGTLVLGDDGAYTYTLNNSDPAVQALGSTQSLSDVFTYEITDGDGDTAQASLSITISGSDDPLFISGTTDNGTTDAQVLESQLATGSAPSGGAVTVSGSFTIAAPDGLLSLDVGGTPILETELLASATTSITVSGTYGSITINGFNGTTGEVSYSYTLNSEADHSSGAVSDSFSLTLTDDDGDTLGGTLGILIVDDVPTANADSAGVSEDNVLVASGNVVTDAPADVIGADGSGTPVTGIVAGTGSAAGTGASVGTSVTGTYGTLVLGDDGAYTYTLNNSDPAVQALGSTQSLSDVFTYEITDGDGDTAQASLSITISGSDDPLAISGTTDNGTTDAQVLESQLATGSAPSGGAVTVSGSFTIAAPDGLASLDVGGTPILETELLASATTSITVSGTYGSITINGFNGTTGEVSYSYTLNSEADHSSGAVSDSFSLTLTDDDGDTLGGTLGILIVDDVPTANADSAGVSEDNVLVASGNVVTDAPADVIGADGSGTPVTGIVAGTGSAAGTGASVGTSVTGTYGTLVLGDDGAYTYTLNNSDPAVQALGSTQSLSDVFTYEITDGDGDTAQASLSITISGSDDPLFISGTTDNGTTDAQVLESQLATGSAPSGGAVTVSGSFTIAAPDGLLSLDVGGTPILETELLASATTSITVSGTYGSITINGFNGTTGEVSYSYTLNSEADHSSGAVSDSFSLTLTDDDGDTLGGTLGILIVDDVPTANADSAGVSEDNVLVASGNVVTDAPADVIGADGSGTPVTGIVAGTGSAAGTGASVGTSVTGTYGTLVLGDDGAYTYTLNNSDPAVQALGSTQSLSDVFTYEITDGDGDTAQASLSITISGSDDPLAISGTTDNGTTDAQVLESQLATGSAPSGGAVTVSGSFTIAAPDGLASLDVGGTPILETELLASATTSITVSGTYGSITINGFNGTTGEVSYSYTLNSEADHSSGAVSDSFSLTLTDDDGDTLGGTLGILIVDDVPTANADSAGVSEDNVLVASGNVVTDAPADVIGADGSGTPVTGIVAGTGSAAGTGASVGTSVTGTYGTLVLGDDGAYTYTLNNSDPAVQALGSTQSLSDVFTYEITDGDGDTAQASLSITISGTNDAPVGNTDTVSATEDTQLTIDIAGDATDVDGDTVSVTEIDGTPITPGGPGVVTADGTVTLSPTGEVLFTPDADFNGTTSFTYTLSDGNGGVTTQTATVEVAAVNDPPVGNTDTVSATEDTQLTIDIAGDATDVDGDTVSVTEIDGTPITPGGPGVVTADGTVTLSPTGEVLFTPDADFNGTTSFTYTLSDGNGGVTTQTATVEVAAVNDPPVGNTDTVSATEDTQLTIDIAGDATDVDGDTVSVTEIDGTPITPGGPGVVTADGTVTLSPTGEVLFTPDADFNGTTSFTYTLSDGNGGVTTQTATVEVAAVNDPPVGNTDTVSATEDTQLTIDIAGDATDVDGDTVSVTEIDGTPITPGGPGVVTADGTVTLSPTGEVLFTPDADFNGTTSFTYTLSDGNGGVTTQTATVEVAAVNDPPVGNTDTVSATEDTQLTIDIAGDATDVDGDTVSVTEIDGTPITPGGPGVVTADGTVTLSPTGEVLFTPDADFNGTTSFTYTLSDGNGGVTTQTATVEVAAVNDPPVGNTDTVSATEDTQLTIDIAGDATDVDGDTVSVTEIDGTPITPGGPGVVTADGTVTLSPTGEVLFTPDADFNGTTSFTYTLSDGNGGVTTQTATVEVAAVNDPPVGNTDTVSATEDTQLTIDIAGDATDVDGDTVSVTEIDGTPITPGGPGVVTADGTVTLSPTGEVLFTPDADFNGTTSFTYTLSDGNGGVTTQTATVEVAAVNDPPVGNTDTVSATEDTQLTIDIAGDATDVDGDTVSVTEIDGTPITPGGPGVVTADGTVTLSPTGEVLFTPDADFNGTTSFTYTLSDGNGGVTTQTATVEVAAVNDPPIFSGGDTTITVTEGTSGDGQVIATDPEGGTFTYTVSSSPGNGTVQIFPDGSYTYTPNPTFVGEDQFVLRVTDSDGGVLDIPVIVTVTAGSFAAPQDQADGDAETTPSLQETTDGSSYETLGENISGLEQLGEGGIDLNSSGQALLIEAVNALQTLGGVSDVSGEAQSISAEIIRIEDIRNTADAQLNRSGEHSGTEPTQAYQLTEFPVKTDVAVAGDSNPSAQSGNASSDIAMQLRSQISGGSVLIELREKPGGGTSRVSDYRVLLANGRPLPGWIRYTSEGIIIIDEAAVGAGPVAIQVMFVVDDQQVVSQQLIVDPANGGQIVEIGDAVPQAASLFSDQLRAAGGAN